MVSKSVAQLPPEDRARKTSKEGKSNRPTGNSTGIYLDPPSNIHPCLSLSLSLCSATDTADIIVSAVIPPTERQINRRIAGKLASLYPTRPGLGSARPRGLFDSTKTRYLAGNSRFRV